MKIFVLLLLMTFSSYAKESCRPNYVEEESAISEVCISNESDALQVRLVRPLGKDVILTELAGERAGRMRMKLDVSSAKEFKEKNTFVQIYYSSGEGVCTIEFMGSLGQGLDFGWTDGYNADHGC